MNRIDFNRNPDHTYLWLLVLFGMATAIVYGTIQVLSAVWLAYELIRSPVCEE